MNFDPEATYLQLRPLYNQLIADRIISASANAPKVSNDPGGNSETNTSVRTKDGTDDFPSNANDVQPDAQLNANNSAVPSDAPPIEPNRVSVNHSAHIVQPGVRGCENGHQWRDLM